jgi:ribosomal protein L11 methyltransferase
LGYALLLLIMGEGDWLEVSLIVDGEMAEAVSEVLARFVPGGVVIESTQIADDPSGVGEVVGPLRVCGYLKVDHQLDADRQKLEEALWHLGQIQPLPRAKYKPIAEADWSQTWKQHFHPVPIGSRMFIVPEWLDVEAGSRIVVRINPGMAFGTGTHPTTKLCLEILEDYIGEVGSADPGEGNIPQTMIDIGCGSGILGIVAAKLGVRHILGVDLDPQAIEVARQNAVVNGVQEQLELAPGSVSEVKSGRFSISRAPLVMANILAPVLVALLREGMGDLLTTPGTLILAGILDEQMAEVEAAIKASGMQLAEKRQSADWAALVVKPRG